MTEHEEIIKLLKELIELVKAAPKTENHYHYHYSNPPIVIDPQPAYPYPQWTSVSTTTGDGLR